MIVIKKKLESGNLRTIPVEFTKFYAKLGFILDLFWIKEFNFWSESSSFDTQKYCSSFKSENSTSALYMESLDKSVWISACWSFNLVFSSAFSPENMSSDMALNLFSLFEQQVIVDSVLLEAEESGKMIWVFSNF